MLHRSSVIKLVTALILVTRNLTLAPFVFFAGKTRLFDLRAIRRTGVGVAATDWGLANYAVHNFHTLLKLTFPLITARLIVLAATSIPAIFSHVFNSSSKNLSRA